jgi:hypothetical protein
MKAFNISIDTVRHWSVLPFQTTPTLRKSMNVPLDINYADGVLCIEITEAYVPPFGWRLVGELVC